MVFFRIKKIKGKEYAYIVENKWKRTPKSVHALRGVKPQGSRQKVKGYIGRVYRFNLKNTIDFLQFKKIEKVEKYVIEKDFKEIIRDLTEWELFRHDIDKSKFTIDLNDSNVQHGTKNVVIMMNEGFFCKYTVNNLFNFKPNNDDSDGYRFARTFVEAGIKVPQDIFVGIFGKLFKS